MFQEYSLNEPSAHLNGPESKQFAQPLLAPAKTDSQLKDAHKQIQDLKAELYSVRKSQREAQQQRDALGARVQELQLDPQEAQQQSWQVPGLEKALAEASTSVGKRWSRKSKD